MKLAFCLFKYFPYGGLQRNMLAFAREAYSRGHEVTIFTGSWQGEKPEGINIQVLPTRGWSNTAKVQQFIDQLQPQLEGADFDSVVGFNKMPGLDVYYAADSCFAHKARHERSWLYRLTTRSRRYLHWESSVFGKSSKTIILEVSTKERPRFISAYETPGNRFFTLPPGIAKNRIAPDDYASLRRDTRQSLGLDDGQLILLALGSGFRTKGLDRNVALLDTLINKRQQQATLLVVGQDNEKPYLQKAKQLGIEQHILFLGGRDDVQALLQASDILVHPAYKENTGNVLLEAMVAGIPVIVTDVCGYAHYVEQADMGVVISAPCSIDEMEAAVQTIQKTSGEQWHQRGKLFAQTADIYSRPQHALNIIEQNWRKTREACVAG